MSYAPISDFGDEPDIAYPARWNYRLIGPAEDAMRDAIGALLEDREHVVRPGNRSRTGRYCSIELELVVESAGDRRALFERLRVHPAFVYVL